MTFGDRFYSVAELADVTGYHRDSIYRAIDSGALAAVEAARKVAHRRRGDQRVAANRQDTHRSARAGCRIGVDPGTRPGLVSRRRRGLGSTHELGCARILP